MEYYIQVKQRENPWFDEKTMEGLYTYKIIQDVCLMNKANPTGKIKTERDLKVSFFNKVNQEEKILSRIPEDDRDIYTMAGRMISFRAVARDEKGNIHEYARWTEGGGLYVGQEW